VLKPVPACSGDSPVDPFPGRLDAISLERGLPAPLPCGIKRSLPELALASRVVAEHLDAVVSEPLQQGRRVRCPSGKTTAAAGVAETDSLPGGPGDRGFLRCLWQRIL
jgi:hypothetical protein